MISTLSSRQSECYSFRFMMRFWIFAVSIVFVTQFLSLHVKADERGAKAITETIDSIDDLYQGSYALLIGVSDYTAGWNDLDQVPGELESAKAALEAHGFEVTLETQKTSHDELEDHFKSFIAKYGYNQANRLVFIFSGHGHTWERGNQGYLVPSDAPLPSDLADGFPGEEFLAKTIQISQIVEWSRQMTVVHALFLFDSCFSGTIFNTRSFDLKKASRNFNFKNAKRKVRQFITAGSANETVPAKSIFMPAFVDGISHGEADIYKDGIITGHELGIYLQGEVAQFGNQSPQFGNHPSRELAKGDFLLVLDNKVIDKARFNKTDNIAGSVDSATEQIKGNDFRDDFDSSTLNERWTVFYNDESRRTFVDNEHLLLVTADEQANVIKFDTPLADQHQIVIKVVTPPQHKNQVVRLRLTQDKENELRLSYFPGWDSIREILDSGVYFYKILNGKWSPIKVRLKLARNETLFLRIAKNGIEYTGSYSTDGLSWHEVGTHILLNFEGYPTFGTYHFFRSGYVEPPESGIRFDFFEMKQARQ